MSRVYKTKTWEQYEAGRAIKRKLRLDETVDGLRDKYGESVIRRAKFTDDPEGHMSGGLDKARRTGVTKPVEPEFRSRNDWEDAL